MGGASSTEAADERIREYRLREDARWEELKRLNDERHVKDKERREAEEKLHKRFREEDEKMYKKFREEDIRRYKADIEKMETALSEERKQFLDHNRVQNERLRRTSELYKEFQLQERKESDEKRMAFEAKQRQHFAKEQRLQECLLEQARQHSEAMHQLGKEHSREKQELHDRLLAEQKEHAEAMQDLLRQKAEDERILHMQQASLLIAHFHAIGNQSLAHQLNCFRTNFSLVERNHTTSIIALRMIEIDFDRQSIGHARGSLGALGRSLEQLESSRNAVISTLEATVAVPIEARMAQMSFFTTIMPFHRSYCLRTQLMLGKLSANPALSIDSNELDELSHNFDQLSDSVHNIPLLPITDGVSQIVGNSQQLDEERRSRQLRRKEEAARMAETPLIADREKRKTEHREETKAAEDERNFGEKISKKKKKKKEKERRREKEEAADRIWKESQHGHDMNSERLGNDFTAVSKAIVDERMFPVCLDLLRT